MAYSRTATLFIEIPSVEIEIEIVVGYDYTPGCEAQTYGPAENCYPAEGPEIEITSAVGKETGLDVMKLLDREQVPLRFPAWNRKTQSLAEVVWERLFEEAAQEDREDGYGRYGRWRRAA